MITLSIDVTLLQKAKFKEVIRRNGKKGIFCELVLIETPNGQYGDYMVKQGSTAAERQSGVELPIIGNGKIFKKRDTNAPPPSQEPGSNPVDDGDKPPF